MREGSLLRGDAGGDSRGIGRDKGFEHQRPCIRIARTLALPGCRHCYNAGIARPAD